MATGRTDDTGTKIWISMEIQNGKAFLETHRQLLATIVIALAKRQTQKSNLKMLFWDSHPIYITCCSFLFHDIFEYVDVDICIGLYVHLSLVIYISWFICIYIYMYIICLLKYLFVCLFIRSLSLSLSIYIYIYTHNYYIVL